MLAFDAFARSLRKRPYNTIQTYCYGLARFFDYFIEAGNCIAQREQTYQLNFDHYVEIIEAYDQYLVHGSNAADDLARMVATSNPSPKVSQSSSETMHAPIRYFLRLAEDARRNNVRMGLDGQIGELRDCGGEKKPSPVRNKGIERSAMQASSMLSSVLMNGPKLLRASVLPTAYRARSTSLRDDQAFPFDLLPRLIELMPSDRDRALYALCAASGCRISEALQLLWTDINFKTGAVRLVNPMRRLGHSSYSVLTPQEREKFLVWKARATEETLMIEPFAGMFFDYLEKYRRNEWRWGEGHDFVFQIKSGSRRGKPYLLSKRGARFDLFKRTVDKLREECADERLHITYSAHSLRHTYGFYLLNYFPRKNGKYGLAIDVVRQMMGHKSRKSTEAYARYDRTLMVEDVAYAQARFFGIKAIQSVNDIKREILLARLEELGAAGMQ